MGESGFTGSTASVLGTCVHYCAERYASTQDVNSEDVAEIEAYIAQECSKDPSIESHVILANYKPMAESLIKTFVAKAIPTHTEEFMYKEILPGIGVGGSCDYYRNGTIGDYKTTSALTAPKTISKAYKFQLLVYAYLFREQGLPADRIQIIYVTRNVTNRISEKTGKPMQDYPSQTTVLSEQITSEDMDFIESIIHLIAHSVDTWNKHPELRYLLAQDWRLHPSQTQKGASWQQKS